MDRGRYKAKPGILVRRLSSEYSPVFPAWSVARTRKKITDFGGRLSDLPGRVGEMIALGSETPVSQSTQSVSFARWYWIS
jgi:hypothetical protein